MPSRDDGTIGVVRTSIQGSDVAPIFCVHHAAVAVKSFSLLDAKRVVRVVEVRPEAEVERRNEENPVERRACAGVGGVVGLRRAEVERMGMPCPRGIAVFDETVSYLLARDQ